MAEKWKKLKTSNGVLSCFVFFVRIEIDQLQCVNC